VNQLDKFVDIVSERKIREAIESGELKNLPGEGKPVSIENLYFLPPEFKFAYTVLKNGGYLNLDEVDEPQVNLNSNANDLLNEQMSNTVKSENFFVSDEGNPSDVKPVNNTEYVKEKTLSYNIMRDCRRGRY
jgi:hypothetical protein